MLASFHSDTTVDGPYCKSNSCSRLFLQCLAVDSFLIVPNITGTLGIKKMISCKTANHVSVKVLRVKTLRPVT